MLQTEWSRSDDPALMLRVACGFRSNCCGCLWADNSDDTISMLPGQKCCKRCDNEPFLDGVTSFASDRKWRLIACAFCRLLWDRVPRSLRRLVGSAERYTDGEGCYEDLRSGIEACGRRISHEFSDGRIRELFILCAASLIDREWIREFLDLAKNYPVQWLALPQILRDIVPSPWRFAAVFRGEIPAQPEVWDSAEVLDIAGSARVDYNPGLVTVGNSAARSVPCVGLSGFGHGCLNALADKLDDLGCADEAVIAHLRSGGGHFRGCWAVDLARGWKDIAKPWDVSMGL